MTNHPRASTSFLPLVLSFALAACSDPAGPENVTGLWHNERNGIELYMDITNDTVDFYYDLGTCFTRQHYEIEERNGSTFTISGPGAGTEPLILRRSGDELEWDAGNDEIVVFQRAEIDADDIEICEF